MVDPKLKIELVNKMICEKSKRYNTMYLVPKKMYRKRNNGLAGWSKEAKNVIGVCFCSSSGCKIYVAKGNGFQTYVTLVHEFMHYINYVFLGNKPGIDRLIEKYL